MELPVDQSWLEKTVNERYGTKAKLLGTSCKVIGEKKGFASMMTQADLDWSESTDTLPSSIVIKKPIEDKMKQIVDLKDVFEEDPDFLSKFHNNEINAYKYFAGSGFPMPRMIYGKDFNKNEDGMLILEKVEGLSTSFLEDNTLDQVKTLVTNLANMQAYGILHGGAEKRLNNSIMRVTTHMNGRASDHYPKLMQSDPDLFHHKAEDVKRVLDDSLKITERTTAGDIPYKGVVCHGDTQPNNILWKVDREGKISNEVAAFVDFQLCHVGYCTYDLAFILFWGLSAPDRKKHEMGLLGTYYDTLKGKVGDRVPLPLPEVKKEYRQMLTVTLAMFIPFLASANDMKALMGFTDERIMELKKKAATVIDDVLG